MTERGEGDMIGLTLRAAIDPRQDQRSRPMIERLAATIALWRCRARERADLARLGERDLRDIGISEFDARCEINKPFWRP
jgi:uncharacterized protein YjiS (DUF1127 family)